VIDGDDEGWRASAGNAADRLKPLQGFTGASWHGRQPPPREWFVEDCFPKNNVGLVSGDGGLGKSLLMHQLCIAASTGQPWLGLQVARCRSLALFCEDDPDELERRHHAICRSMGVEVADTDDFMMVSRSGEESVLMEFDRKDDRAKPTRFLAQLEDLIWDWGAQIVILDTAADVFGGNEIVRNQVRRFVMRLKAIATRISGIVVLTAHPSVSGMSSGSGISGSTAWNNSVRARLYLTAPKAAYEDDTSDQDRDVRVLKTMKMNYGPAGSKVRVRYVDGAFQRIEGEEYSEPAAGDRQVSPSGRIERLTADQQILKAMREVIARGGKISPLSRARTGIHLVLHGEGFCTDLKPGYLRSFVDRGLSAGLLTTVVLVDRGRRERSYIRPLDCRYPEEPRPGDLPSST
jgi:RecA-family ATPase